MSASRVVWRREHGSRASVEVLVVSCSCPNHEFVADAHVVDEGGVEVDLTASRDSKRGRPYSGETPLVVFVMTGMCPWRMWPHNCKRPQKYLPIRA